ncbi:MAG: SDR family NAD(P)-dependent oxidoreductase, partial [Planctomycetes bacterium]|nr:SDR family NAD(P)-dependent oxidoreductase [Planctomycetota bacterium]
LIKAVLMVQHGQIPPHLHLRQPTPYLNWNDWALRIPTAAEPWHAGAGPRRAAVSSFGFSGTNAHVLLEQAPELSPPLPPLRERDWLLLSAGSEAGLRQLADAVAAWLPHQPAAAWAAICASSRQARSSLRWRLALPATSAAEAAQRLREPLELLEAPAQAPRLAFALGPSSEAAHWPLWHAHGVEATALVVPPAQRALAAQLAGAPPRLRLIEACDSAAAELAQHGYCEPLPLGPPQPAQLVQLWLAGVPVQWQPLAPKALWPRQVLPTTPLDRIRCWVEEADTPEPDAFEGLQWQRRWTPVAAGESPALAALWLLGGDAALQAQLAQALPLADLAALDQALEAHSGPPPVLLVAPPSDQAALDLPFWQRWLPLLQGLISRSPQLAALHWLLRAPGTPAGEAWAALARGWARELGAQAGGLLWCGPQGEGLEQLQQQEPAARGGVEWRVGAAGVVEAGVLAPCEPTTAMAAPVFAPTATTLISGGLGALGLATAEALQRWGARHLTLVARRAPSPEQQQRLAALEQLGMGITVEQLDVADGAAVEALFARLAAAGRPLAGIIHAAGVLDDGLLSHQSPERCAAVAAAKVQGALHLDRCSR